MEQQKTKPLVRILNILVLIGSMAILTVLSMEMLSVEHAPTHRFLQVFHLVVCLVFLTDFFVRLHYSQRKTRFFFRNFLFLLVSVPYMNIIDATGISVTHGLYLILRVVPLIRGIYGIAIVVGWITRSKITNLFLSYIITIAAATYFASIVFYALEKGLNPMVKNYWDAAVVWACMNVTTVGSDIFAVTKTGQVFAVLLAASGMLMFPIFTAYITTIFQEKRKK